MVPTEDCKTKALQDQERKAGGLEKVATWDWPGINISIPRTCLWVNIDGGVNLIHNLSHQKNMVG